MRLLAAASNLKKDYQNGLFPVCVAVASLFFKMKFMIGFSFFMEWRQILEDR